MPNKIGVVGDKESVLAFKMLGFSSIFRILKLTEARRLIDSMAGRRLRSNIFNGTTGRDDS